MTATQLTFVMHGQITNHLFETEEQAKLLYSRASEALKQHRLFENHSSVFEYTMPSGGLGTIRLETLQAVYIDPCDAPEWVVEEMVRRKRIEKRVVDAANKSEPPK